MVETRSPPPFSRLESGVGSIIQFNRRDGTRIFLANQKVEAHLADLVVPFVELEALLHPEHPRELELSQDNMIR